MDWNVFPVFIQHPARDKLNVTNLLISPLLLGRHHVVTFVFLHRTQHADAHLVSATEKLQTLLMLGTDLPVQVADLIHQLVPLESGGLEVRLQVLLAVGGQTHQAGLDGFMLLANADVTTYILGSSVVVVRRRWWRWKSFRGAREGGVPGARHASWRWPLVVRDPALWALERTRVVSMVPVGLQANGAEDMAAWDGHWIPEVFLTQVAALLVR